MAKPIVPGRLYQVRGGPVDMPVIACNGFDAIERVMELVLPCSD
jgi:hypothetical protein